MLEDLIGQTKSSKVLQECVNIYKENFNKKFPNYFNENYTKMISLVSVTHKNEIKSLGMSCSDDLLTDNFGKWFGALIFPTTPISLQDDTDVARTVGMWSTGATWNSTNAGGVGSKIEVGNGITPVARSDFIIESLLQLLTSGAGGYNSALGQVDIPATGTSTFTDTITETALYGVWYDGAVRNYLLSHDILSPAVPVSAAETINVDYKLLMS